MTCRTIVLLCVCLCLTPAFGQEIGGTEITPQPETVRDGRSDHDEIRLIDGNVLRGHIVEERDDVIVFETAALGRLEIPRANITRLVHHDVPTDQRSDPDYNSIMFCPTPATLAKGDGYFRSFELFFLNFGFSAIDQLDLSVGTLFPISAEVIMISGGMKFRLLDREKHPIGLALTGSFTKLEEAQFGAFGGVAGIGNKRRSLNVAVNRTFDNDGNANTAWLVGGDIQGSHRSKFFAEYLDSATLFFDDTDDDLKGFVNIGVKFFGDRHSFSISGFRPLLDDSGSFIAWPMVMYSHHF